MGTLEDEIEFFECVPSNLIENFFQRLYSTLKDCLSNKSDKEHILTEMETNYEIFKNFVLRNIFSFPSTNKFSLERKITDNSILLNLSDLVNNQYPKIVDEIVHLKKEKIRIQNKNHLLKLKIDKISSFLSQMHVLTSLKDEAMILRQENVKLKEKENVLKNSYINPDVSGIDILYENPEYKLSKVKEELKIEKENFNLDSANFFKKFI